jgi:hypothetical protein
MSYNVNGQDMLQWFYPRSQPSNSPNTASTTNFRINNVDISNNYNGLGTNSKIPVSQLYTINYFSNGQSLGDLFELNLPNFITGSINDHYKIWPPNGTSGSQSNSGLLIQFFKTCTFKFNYKVDCSFVMVGGGGGGGRSQNNNAGGGGGGGQLLQGSIVGYDPNVYGNINITIGNGGSSMTSGQSTVMTTGTYTIRAEGGGYGGEGKGNSPDTNWSSTGGSGSYSNTTTNPGIILNSGTPPNVGIFQSMRSFGNRGSRGNDNNNDNGGGGGGGGAGGAGIDNGNTIVGYGGSGLTVSFGNTSITLAGGGGGGARAGSSNVGGTGGTGGGGSGGQASTSGNGVNGTTNTGGGGGGGWNDTGNGGTGGSGTIFLYVLPSGVRL